MPYVDSHAHRVFRPVTAPRLRLICFPHAGGTAGSFRGWAERLPAVEVRAIQYAGRQDRLNDRFPASLAALADELTGSLAGLLDTPVALFGHSMGATLAFEVAVRLERESRTSPVQLFVSGRPAPHRVTRTGLHLAGDEQLVEEVIRLGNPDPIAFTDPGLRELVLPALRDDYRLLETHRFDASRRIESPIAAYGGDRDPACRIGALKDWADLTAGAFRQRIFPGDHFYLGPCEPALVADIAEHLSVVAPA